MSSTNRSNARSSHIADYYVTPQKQIRDFIDSFIEDELENEELYTWDVLDPCAGGDEKNLMSYPEALKEYFPNITTYDIREDSRAEFIGDYMWYCPENKFNLIITNPPFAIAKEIIDKALQDVCEGGYVVMLLRLNYFGGVARFKWWENRKPIRAYIHHKRMCFTGDGKTDSIEYMHCVRKKGVNPDDIILKII